MTESRKNENHSKSTPSIHWLSLSLRQKLFWAINVSVAITKSSYVVLSAEAFETARDVRLDSTSKEAFDQNDIHSDDFSKKKFKFKKK